MSLVQQSLSASPRGSQFKSNKIVVVLSGGQDSTTCLFLAKKHGFDIHAITFDYGQRHRIEIQAAKDVANMVGVASHEIVLLGKDILKGTSPLVSDAELEQYADMNSLPGGLEKTFVPMRNQLFLTIAANRAYALGTNIIMTGVCQEDSGGYPDCRDDFIDSFAHTCTMGTFTGNDGAMNGLCVWTPLMYLTKAQSIELATKIPGAYGALAHTHTSYDGSYPPTGNDHATLLRAKGFLEANLPDPLVLMAVDAKRMEMPMTENYGHQQLIHARALMAADKALNGF